MFSMKQTLLIAFFSMFFFCSSGQNKNNQLPAPMIKSGIVKISGSVSGLKLPKGEKNVTISIWNRSLFTGEEKKYVTNLNKENRFSIDFPLECSMAICGFMLKANLKIMAME